MPAFLSQAIDELTRQLAFAPPPRRREQMDNAERLYWQIDPEANYPLEFIVYHITRFRPDTDYGTTLVGAAVRKDLLLLVERLSETLDEPIGDYHPRPLDLAALRKRLGVTAKSISRYRRAGLFARRMRWPNGRRRLGFLEESIERFLESRSPKMQRAADFSRIEDETRHRILVRARRIAGRVDVSPYRVARHLGRHFGRSTEAVRQILLRNDARDARTAIFPEHTPPLTDKQQRIIHRAYHRGVPVARLAKRFNRARNAIYRAINQRRAKALRELSLRYIVCPTFQMPDAREVILGNQQGRKALAELPPLDAPAPPTAEPIGPLAEIPPLDPEVETALFVRYNYLKYRAATLRSRLDRHQPRAGTIDRIETYLRRAVVVKQRIVRANLGLVVSVARKHLAGRPGSGEVLADLISEGNLVLLETVETYDPTRENRFGTYLTWALRRRFFQTDQKKRTAPALTDRTAEYWPATMNPNLTSLEQAEDVSHTLSHLMGELDERERFILTRHFGLVDDSGQRGEPQTLAEVAVQLDISAERARQIERRALARLRQTAAQKGLSFDAADVLPLS